MEESLTRQDTAEAIAIQVKAPTQMKSAIDTARRIAGSVGFGATDCEEIALVAQELASNLITHAGGGQLQFSSLEAGGRYGIQIISEDAGPGIEDVECALADGYSTAGGLGNGLGTVNRMMDAVEFYARPKAGLQIVCQRWVRPAGASSSAHRLEFGAVTRAYRLSPENGDAIVIRQWENNALAGIIDGLGHGPFAQRASQAARHYIESHFDQPLDGLFRGVGRACRATRGVVMALVRFDLKRAKVVVASVGNIEVRLLGPAPLNPVIRRGIVGLPSAPNPVLTEHCWTPQSLLIMHSDGVQTRWQHERVQELGRETVGVLARRLLERYGRVEDDATVVVARSFSA